MTNPITVAKYMTRGPHTIGGDDVMVSGLYLTSEDAPLSVVAAELAELRRGSAVIVKGDHVIGLFTAIDALRALADVLGTADGHVRSRSNGTA